MPARLRHQPPKPPQGLCVAASREPSAGGTPGRQPRTGGAMSHNDLILAAGIAGAVVLIMVWRYLWVIALWAVLVAVDVAVARSYDGWREWAVYAAVPVLFLAWVLFFPDADCRVCNGKGGWKFLMFGRRCRKCGGGKTKQRFTARMIRRGYPRRKGHIIAPKVDKNR